MVSEFDDVNDVSESSDVSTDIDEVLDSMSLDELRDLRETVTDTQDVSDIPITTFNIDETIDNMSLSELRDLRESIENTSDLDEEYESVEELKDIRTSEINEDYGYRGWNGNPTHNVEWDDDVEDPSVHSLKLSKHR